MAAHDDRRKPNNRRGPAARNGARKHTRGRSKQSDAKVTIRTSQTLDGAEGVTPESPWVQLRNYIGGPLVYQRMIGLADVRANPGNVVTVYDKTGRYFGRGLYNPRSQIALRMLTVANEAVDGAFWRRKLAAAVDLRRQLGVAEAADAYRLVHAEGDGLSGLIVERYADGLVFEHFSKGMFDRRDEIAAALIEQLGPPSVLDRPDATPTDWWVYHRADAGVAEIEGFVVPGADEGNAPPARDVVIREHGIRYRVDIAQGHKTGFFCDQRDNRKRLAELARGASVLDLCCYTGGFSLAAMVLGGAAEVTAVDLDEAALAVAKQNANLNNTRVKFAQADAFVYLRQMIADGRLFDVVVLDPPKLCPTRTDRETATAKYHDLNKLAGQVVRPGGVLLTCSCSGLIARDEFLTIVHRALRTAKRSGQLFDFTGPGGDHPVMLNCPESGYLKAAWLRVG